MERMERLKNIETKPKIISSEIVQKIRLINHIDLTFLRDLTKNSVHGSIVFCVDNRSLDEIISSPKPEILSKDVIAIKVFSTILNQAKIGGEIIPVESDPFNFSPLMFLGGRETTYGEAKQMIKKAGKDSELFSAMMNMTERGDNPTWGDFKDSDRLVIARNNSIYSLRPGDLIIPEPKATPNATT